MEVIFKYELDYGKPVQDIEMPIGAAIISMIHNGPNSVFIWAIVDSKAVVESRLETRRFMWFWTGLPLPWNIKDSNEYKFIGTVHVAPLVYHFFEKKSI